MEEIKLPSPTPSPPQTEEIDPSIFELEENPQPIEINDDSGNS